MRPKRSRADANTVAIQELTVAQRRDRVAAEIDRREAIVLAAVQDPEARVRVARRFAAAKANPDRAMERTGASFDRLAEDALSRDAED